MSTRKAKDIELRARRLMRSYVLADLAILVPYFEDLDTFDAVGHLNRTQRRKRLRELFSDLQLAEQQENEHASR
jgi:hypothetical protein